MKKLGQIGTLWKLMRGQRGRYSAAIVAMLVATVVGYAAPVIPAMVIDGLVRNDLSAAPAYTGELMETLGGRDHLIDHLYVPALLLLGLVGITGAMLLLRTRWAANASESICRGLRNRIYDHLQHLPARFHDQAETGDIVQRCTSDIETVRMFLAQHVVELGRAVLMIAAVVPFMLWWDATMTLVATAVVPVIIAFAFVFFLKVKKQFKLADESEGRLTTRLQENLTGIRVVRAFARQDHEIDRFAEVNDEYRQLDFRLYRIMAFFWAASDFLCFSQIGLVLVVGGYRVTQGELSPGALFVFLTYVNMFLWPVRQMGRILSDLGKTTVALTRIGEILDEIPEPDPAAEAQEKLPAQPRGEIAFRGVSFTHTGDVPVLHDVSFTIEPGQTLALLGPSGSGKSTIIHLLLRLYDYEIGSVKLDGCELRHLPRRAARGRFGVVMQEPFLYSKSVRDNIRLGRHAASSEEVVDAANVACIHDSIEAFEDGYETVVGERGVRLSGGQRQRIAIARALVREAPVLILDDALSAVDTETEQMIMQAMHERHGRRTTIVIAHRLSTLRQADHILVLDKGRVVQEGTHETLVSQEGMCRRLWQIQSELEEDLEGEMVGAGAG